MKKTIAEISKESIILTDFLKTQKAGSDLSYVAIEHDTGVTMDNKGKQLLRGALKRLHLEASCRHGYGIVLADPSLVMPILSNKISRIDKAVKRGDRAHRNLQEQFFASLNPEEQKQILFAGAVFGAIRLAAEQGRMIYRKQSNAALPQVHIELPKLG